MTRSDPNPAVVVHTPGSVVPVSTGSSRALVRAGIVDDGGPMDRRLGGEARRVAAARAAEDYDGVLSRDVLRGLGIDRHGVRSELRAQRWKAHGRQTIAVHTGTLSRRAQWWRAVWEVGHGIAALDGSTALVAAGLTGFTTGEVEISVPHGSRRPPVEEVRQRTVIARQAGEVLSVGVPRVRPPIAALRAASWAVSDRQAALLLCMVVQQRLATPTQLDAVVTQVALRRRPAFIVRIIADLLDGAQALGELDFAGLCRARGLPEPSRQVVRTSTTGRIYLDVAWEGIGLLVEIDGAQHRQGLAATDDNLRQNEVVIGDEMVLRIDLVGMRLLQDQFMDQVCRAYRQCSARRAS